MPYLDSHEPVLSLTTGPVPAYPAVLRAMGSPISYDADPVFQHRYANVVETARVALRSRSPPVILQGEPVLALEAAAASLIAADDVVLNLVSGVYGKGFASWARRHAGEVIELEVPFNEAIPAEAVAAELRRRPDVTVVSVCHHDTPSGTLNPVASIGTVVASHGGYFLVDAVSSFGGLDVHPDACAADVFVTGGNKCLGCPPGLSLVGVSDRAWAKMERNPAAPRASALSLLDWKEAWRPGRQFPSTPLIAEINGLAAALDLYLAEGPEQVWARHALTAAACRAGITAMGLELWPARAEISAPTATVVRVPPNLDEAVLRAVARQRYGMVFSGGRGATAGLVTRIGHMGPSAQPIFATLAVTALGGALRALGHPVALGAGVEASLAVIDEASRSP